MERRAFLLCTGNALAISILTSCNKNGEFRFESDWHYGRRDFVEPERCSLVSHDPLQTSTNQSRVGESVFRVGVDLRDQGVYQKTPDLCWAAALETVLAHRGLELDQCEIARFMNKVGCSEGTRTGAHRGDIVLAVDTVVRNFGLHATSLGTDIPTILQLLAADMPVIMGIKRRAYAMRHVCVITNVDYCYAVDGGIASPAVLSATIFDPESGTRSVAAGQFYDEFDFAIRFTQA